MRENAQTTPKIGFFDSVLPRRVCPKGFRAFGTVLLLDDVFDKLDEDRVAHILEMVNGNTFGQIFLSDTHPKRIEDILSRLKLESSVFEVSNLEIQKR